MLELFVSSAGRATLVDVQVTEAHIARIPSTNLRVPRAEFAAVWAAAEREVSHDWYALGVAMTCRWLATTAVQAYDGRWYQAYAPVTERSSRAYEELIEVEYLAAEKLDMHRPRPSWVQRRPGWIEGVCATLRWAWRRIGPPPIQVDERAAG